MMSIIMTDVTGMMKKGILHFLRTNEVLFLFILIKNMKKINDINEQIIEKYIEIAELEREKAILEEKQRIVQIIQNIDYLPNATK